MPEINPSPQRWLTRILLGILLLGPCCNHLPLTGLDHGCAGLLSLHKSASQDSYVEGSFVAWQIWSLYEGFVSSTQINNSGFNEKTLIYFSYNSPHFTTSLSYTSTALRPNHTFHVIMHTAYPSASTAWVRRTLISESPPFFAWMSFYLCSSACHQQSPTLHRYSPQTYSLR
jgi:hypothetical protein